MTAPEPLDLLAELDDLRSRLLAFTSRLLAFTAGLGPTADLVRRATPDQIAAPVAQLVTLDQIAAPEQRVQLVTLDQLAAMVHRSKRTLEKYRDRMPDPVVNGGHGRASRWDWDVIRPWLEQTFDERVPERFPGLA